MNREQTELCREILESILRRPISRMFWELDCPQAMANVKVPITLHLISDRLSRGLYGTPDEFVSDMRVLFSKSMKAAKNSVRSVAASQLLLQFEQLMADLSPSLSPCTTKEQLGTVKLTKIVKSLAPWLTSAASVSNGEPAAEIVKNPHTEVSVSEIATDIRSLFSPALLLRVLAFVYQMQPEAVSIDEEEMSIEFTLLSDENLGKLRVFVNELVAKAAKGEINPFMKGTGGRSRPAFGNAVGM